jgi:hypothetical protein
MDEYQPTTKQGHNLKNAVATRLPLGHFVMLGPSSFRCTLCNKRVNAPDFKAVQQHSNTQGHKSHFEAAARATASSSSDTGPSRPRLQSQQQQQGILSAFQSGTHA